MRPTEAYAYSIDSLMTSDSSQVALYPDLSALTEVYLFEITDPQGQLWTHSIIRENSANIATN